MLSTLETIFIAICMIALSLFMACAIAIGLIIVIGGIMNHIVDIKKSARELKEIKELDRKREPGNE